MQRAIPKLEEYGMKPEYGFLPPQKPSTILSDSYFSTWEAIISDLPQLILMRRIRSVVNDMPILSTSELNSESEWQRAYTMLCFIAHSYIWGDSPAAEILPRSLSIPLLDVCAHLGTYPVTTYAALCLWNFRPLEGQCLINPDNLVALHTFTGTSDESWFYTTSVAVEARGACIIPILLKAMEDVRREDSVELTKDLNDVASILADLGPLLQRVHERLSPQVFFRDIRPFIAGSKTLPKGIIFDDGSGKGKYHQYGGGSAAQSSLFQFCDIVLGVRHDRHGGDADTFIKDMRNYMPGCHRRFLEDVSEVANIQMFLQAHETDSSLTAAYMRCLGMLRAFREKHIGIVSRYIVIPSKAAAREESEKDMVSGRNSNETEISGTGGSPLISFLKQMRDDTSA